MTKYLQILSLCFMLLGSNAIMAQSNFKFTKTSYVGALDANPENDWTTGWTNWDPKTTDYSEPTDLTTLDAMSSSLPVPGEKNITGILTLDASKTYLLDGLVVVRAGGKLVIPAGTLIRCHSDLNSSPKNYGSIVVERGGQIDIQGTANNPVVMTSSKAVGQRDRGDWGGLLLAGRSYHNLLDGTTNDNVQMEGFNNISFDPILAKFGGTDPNDNSGSITYLRLEFGGLAFETNKEINGLTLGAIGAGTVLNHIQVSYSGDDSYEWFGGTVNSSNLIAFKGTDDDFDTDNGYAGLSQFGIGVRDQDYFDLSWNLPSGSSTSEGFESDNEATGTANVKPLTSAIFSNYTMVGPVPVGTVWGDLNATAKSAFRRGARIRRNSSQRIANSIFMGYRNFLMIDGDSCVRNTNYPAAISLVNPNTPVDQKTKQIMFTNNLIVNTDASSNSTTDTTANGLVEVARAKGCKTKLDALTSWIKTSGILANNINPVAFTDQTVLINPLAASTSPNFRPVANSPALVGAEFSNNPLFQNLITATNEISAALQSSIYPNPIINGQLNFGKEIDSFGIFDLNGNLLKYGVETNTTNIDNLAKGVYIIKLDGKAQKLIVQ